MFDDVGEFWRWAVEVRTYPVYLCVYGFVLRDRVFLPTSIKEENRLAQGILLKDVKAGHPVALMIYKDWLKQQLQ